MRTLIRRVVSEPDEILVMHFLTLKRYLAENPQLVRLLDLKVKRQKAITSFSDHYGRPVYHLCHVPHVPHAYHHDHHASVSGC